MQVDKMLFDIRLPKIWYLRESTITSSYWMSHFDQILWLDHFNQRVEGKHYLDGTKQRNRQLWSAISSLVVTSSKTRSVLPLSAIRVKITPMSFLKISILPLSPSYKKTYVTHHRAFCQHLIFGIDPPNPSIQMNLLSSLQSVWIKPQWASSYALRKDFS